MSILHFTKKLLHLKQSKQIKRFKLKSYQIKHMKEINEQARDKDNINLKYQVLDGFQEAFDNKWYRLSDQTKYVLDEVAFLGKDSGFIYARPKHFAEKCNVSEITFRKNMKQLEDLGQVVRVYQPTSKCNGVGTPIYLLVNHVMFDYWIDYLGLKAIVESKYQTEYQTENAEIPCESKSEGTKKVPTYYLPLKQEKDIINNAYNPYLEVMQKNEVRQSIKQHVGYRVDDMLIKDPLLTDVLVKFVDVENDNLVKLTPEKIERIKIFVEHQIIQAIDEHEITINHMSSYVGVVLKSIKTKALLIEDKGNKQPQQTQARTVSFYNWLDETPVGTAPVEETPVEEAPVNESISLDSYLDVLEGVY